MMGNDGPFDPRHLLHYPRLVLWGANHFSSRLPDSRAWLYWDKRGATGSNDGSDGELAWTNLRAPLRRFAHLWRGVCRASETGTAHLGPTQKPIALVEWVFRDRAKLRAGDLVLVPYCGSGPELVVCRRMQLRCIAVDIDPLWAEVAIRERLLVTPRPRRGVRIATPPPRLRIDAAPFEGGEAIVESEMPSSEESTALVRRARWA
jgi:site-specific DNA-methyltransferase (adenine-specific)